MPVLRRLVTVALVLVPTCAVGAPAASAEAGGGVETVSLLVDRSAWSWRRVLPVGGLPVAEPSQVPAGSLVAAADGDPEGRPAKATYLHLDLAAIATAADVHGLTLTLPVDPSEDGLDAADVRLVACPLKAGFVAGEGLEPGEVPADDCASPAVGRYDDKAKAWTFTLTPYAQRWVEDASSNHGVVVRPPVGHVLPDGKPFQITFAGAARVRAELAVSLPVAPPVVPETPVEEPAAPLAPAVVLPALPPMSGGSVPVPQSVPAPPQTAPVVAAPTGAVVPVAPADRSRVLAQARTSPTALWSLAALIGLLLLAVARVAGNTAGPAAFARLERERLDRIRLVVPTLVVPDYVPDLLPVSVPQRRHGRRPISSATSTVT